MLKYILKRFLALIPILIIVSAVIFMIVHLTPGDPAALMLGDQATTEEIEALRQSMGLNDPILVQYFRWVGNILTGNLGKSIYINEPMGKILVSHLGPTVELATFALIIAVFISLPLGMIAARKRGTPLDSAVSVSAILGISIPSFLMSIFLVLIFSVNLRWFPVAGFKTLSAGFGKHIKTLVLPAFSLGLAQAALMTRMSKASVVEVLGSDYIKMAKSKGVKEVSIVVKHALRNAILPIITVIGQSYITLMSGATVVETVFGIPGMGQLVVNSVSRNDYEVIQAVVLVIAVINVVVMLVVDIMYALFDPRVKLS